MKPRTFYDLVIEIAIIRPGPIQGGMIQPYIRRREGTEPVTYPSPEMETVLSRTLGVPIFQEQVMQIAMVAAGFTAGEADRLRRAMAAWKRKGNLEQFEDQLMAGMAKRGYNEEFAKAIVAQIRGFASYGFPESHSASFALLAYASSWLRCHEPGAFLCALLNSQPMGFYQPSQLVQDAQRHGVAVLPVDVMISNWDSSLEPHPGNKDVVRLGMSLVDGLEQEAAWRIEEARAAKMFDSVEDLARRARLNRRALNALSAANALLSLAGNRRQAAWIAAASVPDKDMLRGAPISEEQIVLPALTEGQSVLADYRSLGLTLGKHPLAFLREQLKAKRFLTARELNDQGDGAIARACGVVTVRQQPGTAKGVVFVTIEDETGQVNVIVWQSMVEKYRKEVYQARLLAVYGKWQNKSNVRHLVSSMLVDFTHLLGDLETRSRNFC
jgi:error-prone DNA polymerase